MPKTADLNYEVQSVNYLRQCTTIVMQNSRDVKLRDILKLKKRTRYLDEIFLFTKGSLNMREKCLI